MLILPNFGFCCDSCIYMLCIYPFLFPSPFVDHLLFQPLLCSVFLLFIYVLVALDDLISFIRVVYGILGKVLFIDSWGF